MRTPAPASPKDDEAAFDRLAPEGQALRRKIAEGRAKAGTCMLCDWIVRRHRPEDFPERARKFHLMICCDPALVSNKPYLE